jgi:hypothetical protein
MSTRPWTTPGIESLPDLMGLTHQGDGHSRGLVRGLDGDDAADDPHQSLSLVIVDPTNPHTFSHRASLGDQRLRGKTPGGQRSLLRH